MTMNDETPLFLLMLLPATVLAGNDYTAAETTTNNAKRKLDASVIATATANALKKEIGAAMTGVHGARISGATPNERNLVHIISEAKKNKGAASYSVVPKIETRSKLEALSLSIGPRSEEKGKTEPSETSILQINA